MEKREAILKACGELVDRGLTARTWGNISCRVDEKHFIITPSGRSYDSLEEKHLVKMKIDDLTYEGDIKPSSEKGVHAEIYKMQPEAKFVIHTHQTFASAVSALGEEKIKVPYKGKYINGDIVCSKYALPSTKSLCKNVTEALRKTQNGAVIMNNHGTICFGRSYEEVFGVIIELEDMCRKLVGLESDEYNIKENESSVHKLISWLKEAGISKERICVNRGATISEAFKGSKKLKSLLDDYAQMMGTGCEEVAFDKEKIQKALKKSNVIFISGIGGVCIGETEDESKALSTVLQKNSIAFLCCRKHNKYDYIKKWECRLMRVVYKRSYSKRKYQK